MTPEQWEALQSAFEKALALNEPERSHFVQNQFATEPELRAEFERLLAANDTDDEALLEPVVATAASLADGGADPWVGKAFGSYKATKRIATGGMSAVYLGRRTDDDFEQNVAIKIVANNILSEELQRRFKVERQILASLQHRYVAQLYDGGTTADGLPYFVMEYVEGLPIDEYCDKNILSVGERLELFTKVCTAVDYAHRNLVVHRDIKPSNIIVANDGTPKLLDFGIAKPLDQAQLKQTIAMTRADMRAMTPEYASPEQVRGENVTTATDVYSLGVLLYKLLSGYMPYLLKSHSVAAVAKVICETMPSRPSTIIGGDSDKAPRIVALRGTTISKLQKTLSGDLDNIVLATLHKDPERRYLSARALSDDISRYRANEPIHARTDSLAYRTRKFINRNYWAVAAAGTFVATVAVLTITYTNALTVQRDRAQLQADRANEVAAFMGDLFSEADPRTNLGEPLTAEQILERGADRVVSELSERPALQAALLVTIVESYYTLYKQNTIFELLGPVLPDLTEKLGREHADIVQLVYRYEYARSTVDDMNTALQGIEANYAIVIRKYGRSSFEAALHLIYIAHMKTALNRFENTEAVIREAIEILRGHGGDASQALTNSLMEYGILLRKQDRIDEVEPLLLEALSIQETRVGRNHPDFTSVLNNVGNHYQRRGKFDEASEHYKELVNTQKVLFGVNGIPYGVALMNYANSLMSLDMHDDSLSALDDGLRVFAQHRADDGTRYAYALENKGNLLRKMKRFDEAEPLYLEVLAIMEGIHGRDHFEYAISEASYAGLLNSTNRWPEALSLLEHAVGQYAQAVGEDNSQTLRLNIRIANLHRQLENYQQGLNIGVPALAGLREAISDAHPDLLNALHNIGLLYRDSGNYIEADALFVEALETNDRNDGPTALAIQIEPDYAESLVAQGRADEAIELLSARRESLLATESPLPLQLEVIDSALESLRSRNGL